MFFFLFVFLSNESADWNTKLGRGVITAGDKLQKHFQDMISPEISWLLCIFQVF